MHSKIDINNIVTTLAGNGNIGSQNDKEINAQVYETMDVAADKTAKYLPSRNNKIRKIDIQGNVTTFVRAVNLAYKDATNPLTTALGITTSVEINSIEKLIIAEHSSNLSKDSSWVNLRCR